MKESLRFVADDGLEFDSWVECWRYEQFKMPIVPKTGETKYLWKYTKSKHFRVETDNFKDNMELHRQELQRYLDENPTCSVLATYETLEWLGLGEDNEQQQSSR